MIHLRGVAFLVLLGAGMPVSQAGADVSSQAPVFDLSGEIDGPLRGSQRNPAGAWNGEVFLVVWDDERGANKDVYGMRLDAAGRPLDPGGFQITNTAGSQRQPTVAAMADGQFLVAWEDRPSGTLMGNVVARDGSIRYADDITIAAAAAAAAEASIRSKDIELADSPAGILAVWEEHWTGGTRLIGRILDRSTGMPDAAFPPKRLASQAAAQEPSVASSGERFYVAWEDVSEDHLYGVLVDPKQWGRELAEPTRLGEMRNAGGDPEVVGGPDGFLVAWLKQFQDPLDSSNLADAFSVEIAQVGGDGSVSSQAGSSSMLLSGSFTSRVSLAFARLQGDRYVVAWQREAGDRSILRGMEYSAAGGFSSEAISLAERFSAAQDPDIVTAGGRTLLVWEDGRHDGAVDSNEDIYARFSPAGGFAELGAESLLSSARDTPLRTPLAVGTDGDGFVVLWRSESELIADGVFGAHLGADGRLSPAGGHLIASGAASADIASDGDGYLVAWSGGNFLGMTSLPSSAEELGLMRSKRREYSRNPPGASVAIASDGSDYILVWTRPGEGSLMSTSVADDGDLDESYDSYLGALGGTGNQVAISGAGGQFAIFWEEAGTLAGTSEIKALRVRTLDRGGVEAIDWQAVVVESAVSLVPGMGLRASAGSDGHRYYWMDRQLAVRSRVFSYDSAPALTDAQEAYAGEVGIPIQPAIANDGVDAWFVSAWRKGGQSRVRVSRQQMPDPDVFSDSKCVFDFDRVPLGVSAGHDGSGLLFVTGFPESRSGAGDARLVGYRVSLARAQMRISELADAGGHRIELRGEASRRYLLQESGDLKNWSAGTHLRTDDRGVASLDVPADDAILHRHFRVISDFK